MTTRLENDASQYANDLEYTPLRHRPDEGDNWLRRFLQSRASPHSRAAFDLRSSVAVKTSCRPARKSQCPRVLLPRTPALSDRGELRRLPSVSAQHDQRSGDASGTHGFLYSHGTYTTIDPPGGGSIALSLASTPQARSLALTGAAPSTVSSCRARGARPALGNLRAVRCGLCSAPDRRQPRRLKGSSPGNRSDAPRSRATGGTARSLRVREPAGCTDRSASAVV